jgi:uncharacterized protein (DUF1697 family)
MPTQIALLRGVNVGGWTAVAMAELRATGRNWNTALKLAELAQA